jgi:uncharacterized protein (TIGR00255 family)
MTLQSMTGFARREGSCGRHRFVWELRSVNGKSLDIRFRLPSGMDRLEADFRRSAAARLARGNVQASLTLSTNEPRPMVPVVNDAALAAVIVLAERLSERLDVTPPTVDGLLALRGVLDMQEQEENEAERRLLEDAVSEAFEAALGDLVAMRCSEGAALRTVLLGHVDAIARLTQAVEADPSRRPETIQARLRQQLAMIMEAGAGMDPQRLYAEVALLAAKADLREEIDRLTAHVAAARALLSGQDAVGRRLDFLAQEFNRETNTICSKSNAAAVTALGLDLKVVIDQFREQVQNLE